MSEQPEILQMTAAWLSQQSDKQRKIDVLSSCWSQWMQLERDKHELRKMVNNQVYGMTQWQKNIERDMKRLYAEVTKEVQE